MKSSRVRISTASELLRKDTFAAERLMDLHTLYDYKKRQINRLRQEEKELAQLVSIEKEIASKLGKKNLNSLQETENTPSSPKILTKKQMINIKRSHSSEFLNEKLDDIPAFGSANDVFEQINSNIPHENSSNNINSSATLPRQSLSFVNSRQNFYQIPSIASFIQKIQETDDYNMFFDQIPLSLILVSGFYGNEFPSEALIDLIESWQPNRRESFFKALIEDMRNCAKFMNLIFELANILNIPNLTNICETRLPYYFNAKRVCLLFYDSPNEELVFVKEKIHLRFPVKQGIFMKSLLGQFPIVADADDPEVTQNDRAIIQQNKNIFIIPVLSIKSQFNTEGLLVIFDKNDGVKSADYLSASIIARCVSLTIPILRSFENTKERRDTFSKTVNTYISLCACDDLASLIHNISISFTEFFQCEAIRIFKVYMKSRTYREVTMNETLGNSHSFTTGIVGYCISNFVSLNITKPQFHYHYSCDVDRFDDNSFSSSLLVSTIPDSKKVCRWVIALYNRSGRSSFTQLEEESLNTICSHLYPLIQNAWEDKKLKNEINHSKKHLAIAEALTETIASLKSPTDIDSVVSKMTKFFKKHTPYQHVSFYSLDTFRKELISNSYDYKFIEIIPLDSNNDIAECARTAKIIEKKIPNSDTKLIYCPILNSLSSVIGVIKVEGGLHTPSSSPSKANIGSKQTQSSQSITSLNTFKSSHLSSTSLETEQSETSDELESVDGINEKENKNDMMQDHDSILRIMKTWQKVAGSVLEGSQKHTFYSRRKQLIDNMSVALFENLFDSNFKVWQEVQCFVDGFEDLDDTSVNIESPVITDLVFANTSELSEKTVLLLKSLQALNSIDQTIFSSQLDGNNNSNNVITLYEDESPTCIFLTTSAIDLLSMEEGEIIQNIIITFTELQALHYLNCNERDMREYLLVLRSLHLNNCFRGWKLAVDHFQFAAFLMLNTVFGKLICDNEIISILFFLLSLYCDPSESISDNTPLKRARFTLETSGSFSTVSSFFTSVAFTSVNIFKSVPKNEMAYIYNTIDEYDSSASPESFLNSTPAFLLCCLSRYSHMMRETSVTIKWYDNKIREDFSLENFDDTTDIKEYQLQMESEVIIEPILNQAIKVDPSIESLLKRFQSNRNSINEK